MSVYYLNRIVISHSGWDHSLSITPYPTARRITTRRGAPCALPVNRLNAV